MTTFFSFQNIDNYIYDYLTECFFLVNIKYVVIKFAIGTLFHRVNAIPLYPYIFHLFIVIIII